MDHQRRNYNGDSGKNGELEGSGDLRGSLWGGGAQEFGVAGLGFGALRVYDSEV